MNTFVLFMLILTGQLHGFEEDLVLDRYVQAGLESNLTLRQQVISIERSIAALEEAHGLFYPSVSFQTRYTRADGGRTIEIPIGDLMNPVYATLNQLLAAQGHP